MIEVLKVLGSLFLAVTVHEGGHAGAVALSGGRVTSFKPYPSNGFFGYTEYVGLSENAQKVIDISGVSASMLSTVPIRALEEKYPKETFFKYWDFWATADLPIHSLMALVSDKSDLAKFSDRTGVPIVALVGLSFLWATQKTNKNVLFTGTKVFFVKEF